MSSHALPAKAQHLFRYLFEQASLGIAVEDLEGKILLANPALCTMLGYTENELVGMSCSQFANPEDSQDDWALFQQLQAGVIDHYALEKRYLRKDGSPLWGRLNVSLLKEDDGESPLVFAFVENITEHKQAGEAIQQKEKELTETQHLAGIGSWLWDARTDRMIWSKEISLRTGHDPNSPAPKLKEQAGLFTPESWDRLQRTVQEAVQTGTSYELDLELVSPLSGVRWATTRGEPIRDANGQVIGLRGTVQDITKHKLAEHELARLNDRFRLAMEASKSVGWEWDLQTGCNTWFGDLQTMFGISSYSFDGKVEDFFRRLHPEDQKMVARAVADAKKNQTPYAAEYRVVRLDGTLRWVAARGTFYYAATGEPVRMVGIAVDITDRKRTEERLREYEKTVEGSTDSITVIDREYRYLIANRTFLKLRNMTKEQAVGRLVSEVLNKGVFEAVVKDKLDECFAGKVVTYGLKYTYPELGERDLLLSYFPIEGSSGIDRVACIAQDITERKRAQDGLRESEQRLRLAIQAGRMYAFEWNVVTDEIVRSKESVETLNWRDPEHDTGRAFRARVHPDDRALYDATEAQLTPEDPTYQISFRTFNPDGNVIWLEDTGRASFDAQGRLLRVMGMVADITERKQVQEALKKSEEKFSKAFQHGPMALTLTSAKDHRYIDVNETFERITGWRRDEVIGRTPLDIELWVNPAERFELAKRVLTEQNVCNLEYRFRMRDGSIRIGLASTELIDLEGEPCMLAVIADITDYKRSQDALLQSESRERARVKELKAILDAVPVPVLITHDAECQYMTGNRAASEQLRVPRDQNFSQSAPPGERPAFRHLRDGVEVPADLLPMQQAAATGEPVYGRELTLLFEDGTTREEIANAVPLLDESGKPRGAVGASMDVTELKRTEAALRESEDKLRLLLDSTAEAIYGIDLEHRCTFCNPASLRALGYEHVDEVLGKNMHKLVHHTRPDGALFPIEECRVHRLALTGEGVHAEDEVFWRANGTSFPAEYWSYPQRRGQEVIGAVVAFIDITERKLAEAALANVSRKLIEAQEQERSRIGRELHDDIGQRLSLVAVELEQMRNDPHVFTRVRRRLGELQKKISGIAIDTQSLSHELHSAKLQYLGIAAAMRGFCREFGEQQQVRIDFKAVDLPGSLSADLSLCLFRVLQEALHNSAKHSGVRHFEVRLWGTTNEIHLTVTDSGQGFDRETAKTSQGLGLISMEERLKLVNGALSIESQPGRGTKIEARVPVSSGSDSMRAVG